jgi:hypothetical protein
MGTEELGVIAKGEAAAAQLQRISQWLLEHPIPGEQLGSVDAVCIRRLETLEKFTKEFEVIDERTATTAEDANTCHAAGAD